jgi:hypothetical protein
MRDAFAKKFSTRRRRLCSVFSACVFCCLGPTVRSAEPATDAAAADRRERLIQELLKRVEGLETEVQRLKSAGSPAGPSEVPSGADETGQRQRFPDLRFHGFGDVQYHVSDGSVGEDNSFSLGTLDFFITSRLAEDVSVLNETVLRAGNNNKFGITIERLLLEYSANDYFNIDIGRGHTAIGYWNTAYHHGSWFQTSVDRPFIFAFNGILPIHYIGVSANGHIPSGSLGLRYIIEVGNGRHYSLAAAGEEANQNVIDDNDFKAVNVGLTARPDWAPGLQVGISAYHDWLTPAGLPRTDQLILATHVVYKTSSLEWLNEFLLLRHKPVNGSAHYTPAFYTQIAPRFGRFQPYVRYQWQNAPTSDAIFANFGVAGVRQGPSVGMRYDFTDFAALKVQYDYVRQENKPAANEVTGQVGFTF